ncbi:LuxE/PaaK family acyltransferase [Gracilimonas sp. BCB1]|uniref:LuxE/PaaK family acyltransferase n=1 Tax=Gracilimonas sp. BCB1 TaxID=3152362 RepID=UPI0032D9737B
MMITPEEIFDTGIPFEKKALEVFEFQRNNNPVYQRFCQALGIGEIHSASEIPLLPIQAFKEIEVLTASENSKSKTQNLEFQSSGTSGMSRSRHLVPDPEVYRQSIIRGMKHFYELDDYVIWAYTPGYIENPNSSLIWMLNALIERETSGLSRFLDLDQPIDHKELDKVQKSEKKLMLFGAAFGLLDMLEKGETKLPKDSVILETGGMKTHRREITKAALHEKLASGFGLPKSQVHSEYGMAELLSQAYSREGEWFECVPWMKVSIRNPKNPMEEVEYGEEGLIGVMDLANLYSCSFILTGDKGLQRDDGKFQVLGRWNPENLRGCNFLIDQD